MKNGYIKDKACRIVTLILCAVLFTAVLTSCGQKGYISPNRETTKLDDVELSNRQESILNEMQLPTDYSALSIAQKQAIVAIEDALSYLEEKYEKEFTFIDYSVSPDGAEETITVSLKDTPNCFVTVNRLSVGGEYEYSDDYVVPEDVKTTVIDIIE